MEIPPTTAKAPPTPSQQPTDTEKQSNAELIKNQGNAFYKAKKFQEAINKYSEAVDTLPNKHPRASVFLCNRSMCYLKLEQPGQAILDAELAAEIDPLNIKSFYRKAIALYALSKLKDAINALKHITIKLKVNGNKDVNMKLALLKKLHKKQVFFKAIEFEDETDQLDPGALSVPASYNGPVIGAEEPLTRQWVLDLLDYFQDQKKLHKKFVWILVKRLKDILDAETNLNFLRVEDDHVAIEIEEGVKPSDIGYTYEKFDTERYRMPKITVCGDIHGILSLVATFHMILYVLLY